jgi:hypothetical protein
VARPEAKARESAQSAPMAQVQMGPSPETLGKEDKVTPALSPLASKPRP